MGECVKAIRKPDVPRYDPTKDGNPFYWILRTAAQQRNEEEATASRLTVPADEWIVTKTASEVIKTTARMGKHQISAE